MPRVNSLHRQTSESSVTLKRISKDLNPTNPSLFRSGSLNATPSSSKAAVPGAGHTRPSPTSLSCLQTNSSVVAHSQSNSQTAVSETSISIDVKHKTVRSTEWPKKSSLYLLRTDGKSCTRELVTGSGKLRFAYPSTQQHLLVWRHRPRSVMIIKKLGNELLEEFLAVADFLSNEHNLKVLVEPDVYEEEIKHRDHLGNVYTYNSSTDVDRLAEYVDFVVCLGGDGVILHASHLFKSSIPPVIAFNLGSMGFLTNHSYHTFRENLEAVIYGAEQLDSCTLSMDSADEVQGNSLGVMVTLRMRLQCEIFRRGSSRPDQVYEVLNEMVIDRGSSSFLTNIECYERGRFITRVQADGILIATPTGSTAYSVAAGGSMVHPNVPAILLTPVCPHSLSFRPIILPDYAELEFRIPDDSRCTAWICFDGRSRQELSRGDSVRIKMSENPVPTINKDDLTADWFDSLERCFRWSERCQQKPLSTS